jgi:outer membrane protein assembly factor BamB
MKISELVFIGIKGSVLALNRSTGEKVWATHLKGSDFVNVVMESDRVLATAQGEVFCLEPLTGAGLWHNPLKGFGMGLATMATEGMSPSGLPPVLAEHRRREQAAQAAA